jgi:hypothetical protein
MRSHRSSSTRSSGMADPWNGPRPHFHRWSHLSETKGLSLQNFRTRLVIFDHMPLDRQSHGGKLIIHFDLLGSQEMVEPFILFLWAIRPNHDHRKIGARTVITPEYVVGSFLDQALPLDCTRIQLRSRSGGICWMTIETVKTEPEIELENPQTRQLSGNFLADVLVYGYVRTRPSSGLRSTYQEAAYDQVSGIIVFV